MTGVQTCALPICSHNMSLRCYIIPADCTNDIHYKQSCPKQKQTVHNHILWLNIKCSIQIAQNLRKCKINRTDHKCTEHIKKEHSLIWLIIAYKFLHNFHSKIPPFRILHYYTRFESCLQIISTHYKIRRLFLFIYIIYVNFICFAYISLTIV